MGRERETPQPEPTRVYILFARVRQFFSPLQNTETISQDKKLEVKTDDPQRRKIVGKSVERLGKLEVETYHPQRRKIVGKSAKRLGEGVNKDRFSILSDGVAVVAGMVGSSSGDEAAEASIGEISILFKDRSKVSDQEEAEAFLENAIGIVNEKILNIQTPNEEPSRDTIAIAYPWKDKYGRGRITFGHVGNSRVYKQEKGLPVQQITLDDGSLREYSEKSSWSKTDTYKLQSKMSDIVDPNYRFGSFAELDIFRTRHHITQALGDKEVTPRIITIECKKGVTYAMFTKGITHNLTDEEIGKILNLEDLSNSQKVDELIDSAFNRSKDTNHPRAKDDDMTVLLITTPEDV